MIEKMLMQFVYLYKQLQILEIEVHLHELVQ